MFNFFFFMSVIFSILSYLNKDPMKSSFFLVFSLIFCIPLLSYSIHVWFSYFVCMLFLSGVFVILVYFASLSKVSSYNSGYLSALVFVLSILLLSPILNPQVGYLSITSFYYSIYWNIFLFIIISLLFFMNFSSYFLSFSGALRKF